MKVNIAGFNVDIKNGGKTPETLCAAYARVSRDPRDLDILRQEAIKDVEKARKSCENIVYDYSHKSIAEHAVFNFDIIDVSRLLIEEIQHSRLVSYTEKSQRYQKLDNDFVVPSELDEDDRNDFKLMVNHQFNAYKKIYKAIFDDLKQKEKDSNKISKNKLKLLENKSKEDARYITPLCMIGQLGMTINARNLTSMIRRLKGCGLIEGFDLGDLLERHSFMITPSLIKRCNSDLKFGESFEKYQDSIGVDVILLNYNDYSNFYNIFSYEFGDYSFDKFEIILKQYFSNLSKHDNVSRSFEFIDFIFKINCSASCFAQLKRHRMASIIKKDYYPYSYIIPESIMNSDKLELFENTMINVGIHYDKFRKKYGKKVAEYILTQANRRSLLFKCNARELYHMSRLRCDKHAQWEIRELVNKMLDLVKKEAPLIFMLACGKDKFDQKRKELFGEK